MKKIILIAITLFLDMTLLFGGYFLSFEHKLTSISAGEGMSFVAPVPSPVSPISLIYRLPSDDGDQPQASRLKLFENGVLIGQPHTTHQQIREQGGGAFSHWTTYIMFSTSDGSDARTNGKNYYVKSPYSLNPSVLGIMIFLNAIVLLMMAKTLWIFLEAGRRYLFWGACAILWLYMNVVFVQLISAPVPSPDSGGYLNWSLLRTIGYPALLDFYYFIFKSWTSLPIVQLNLLLVGLFGLSNAIARISGSYTVGWFFLALVLSACNMLLFAADILTESAFSGFVMMHLAFMYLLLMDGRKVFGLFAGMALAAAILIKSVAVVFFVPLFLFLLFVPEIRKSILILICPAFIAWLTPSAYNYARNGVFESSSIGGIALAGHVAWAIHPNPGSAYPEEAKRIEHRLKPILAKRPVEFKSIEEYVYYTSNEINGLLWGGILPELRTDLDMRCTWSICEHQHLFQVNKILLQLAKETIANNPGLYAKHVLAHYYGMWKYVFSGKTEFLSGANQRAESLPAAYNSRESYQQFFAPIPSFKSQSERNAMVFRIESSHGKKVINLLSMSNLFNSYVTNIIDRSAILILIVGLIASGMVFRLRKISPAAKAFCYTGLLVNAYFMGTALATSAIQRYSWAMQGAVAALIFLGLFLAIKCVIGFFWANEKSIHQTSRSTKT